MHLTLHLTRACNLRCDYCYAPPRPGDGMTLEVARQAMRLGAGLTNGSCGIVFFGGEPLLHKDLIRRVVTDARQSAEQNPGQFHFKLTTNGLLLDDEFLDFTVANDVLVAMSFDGVRQSHDRHRRLPDGRGTFDVLLPTLHRLLAARPYASVLTVVNPDTVGWLADSMAFLLDQGCRYLIVSLNFAGAWSPEQLDELQRQYEQLGQYYIAWSRAGRKFYLSPFEVKLASHILGEGARCQRCELGQRQISVDPQGYLYPCVQFTAAGPASPWRIGHVASGIDAAARQRLHDQSEAEKAPCRACALRDRCHNTCGCLNWQTTGSVNQVSPLLCRHEQMLTPIADRVGATLYAERNERFLQKHYNPAYPILSWIEDNLP
jgi:uncharacterized protein